MRYKNYSCFVLLCLVFSINAKAQVKDSLDYKFEIDKKFVPILSDAIKIPVNPNPEKPDIIKRIYAYQIPEQHYAVQPTIYTIKPISLGNILLPKLRNNYTKVGFGNYASPLIEFYLNTTRNKKTQAGLFFKHFSANGDAYYNSFSNNTIYAYVKQFVGKSSISMDAKYVRNGVNLYAAPNDKIKNIDPKLVYQLFELNAGFQNYLKDSNGLVYKTDINFYNYSLKDTVNENNFNVKAKIEKVISNIPFELATGLQINNTKNNASGNEYTRQRIYFDLNPQLKIGDENFYIKGGFNSTIASDTVQKFYFFPKAECGYNLISKKLNAFAGISGNLKVNTFRSITSENPFSAQFYLNNTVNKFEIYGGFKGELGAKTNFMIMSSSATIQNMLFYIHDSLNAKQITAFDTQNGQLTTLSININHAYNEKFRLGITANVYGYNLKELAHPYSRPEFEAKANATYNMGDKFLLKFDLFYMAERWGALQGVNKNLIATKMPAFADANFGIDYRYNKTVSAFINFNNIANNAYQRFYSYPVYGFNLMGGFTFTF